MLDRSNKMYWKKYISSIGLYQVCGHILKCSERIATATRYVAEGNSVPEYMDVLENNTQLTGMLVQRLRELQAEEASK